MQDYLMRMLFGTSKIVIDNMDAGMLYGKVKKIISVNIVYFDLGHGNDYIYHGTTSFTGMNKKDTLSLSQQEQVVYHTEKIATIYPEYYIIKVNQFDDIAKNTLDEWISFLKREEVGENTKAKGLKEAKEKLDILKLSKEERREYEWYISNWRDTESAMISNFTAGELKGKMEGRREEKIEMAKNCITDGMSIEKTAKLTGLTEEEIRGMA